MRRIVVQCLAVVALLGVAAPVSAHIPERAGTTTLAQTIGTAVPGPAPPVPVPVDPALTKVAASPLVLWLVLLSLTASLIAASRSRRTAVSLLSMLLAVFAVEGSVHSVHHLGEPRDAVRCVVESVSSNLSGVAGESVDAHGSTERADVTTTLEPLAPPQRSLGPQGGRAPPFPA